MDIVSSCATARRFHKVIWSLPNGELQLPHDECISRHVDFLDLQLKLQVYPKGDLDDLDVLRLCLISFFVYLPKWGING